MLQKILKIIAGLGAILSAWFYVLMRQAKDEQKQTENELKVEAKENEALKTNLEAIQAAEEAVREERKANEELVEKAHSSNNLDAFNACNDLLSK